MSVIAWLLVGLLAGYAGDKLVSHPGRGIVGSALVGTLGAFAGGFTFNLFFEPGMGIAGANIWSMVLAVVGAIVVLVPFFAFRATRGGKNRPAVARRLMM